MSLHTREELINIALWTWAAINLGAWPALVVYAIWLMIWPGKH